MKLLFAIVNDEDAPRLMAELNRAGHRVTRLSTTGGFLRSGNTTLMTVYDANEQENVLAIIRKHSSSRTTAIDASLTQSSMGGAFVPYPVEVQVGGATVFVVNVEHFEKI